MITIDLTHQFTAEMPVWPGDPVPVFTSIASIANDGFADEELTSGLHVGTHIDAPAHVMNGGKLLSDYPIERFSGHGVLVDARHKSLISADLLRGVELQQGDIVLVLTGWSVKYHEPVYFERFPEFAEDFADKLVEAQVSMVGSDTPSPDKEPYLIHQQLLGSGVLIAENLNHLDQLANVPEFDVVALPINLVASAAPARIVARTK